MATDYAKLTENLCRFYDFADKVVLYIGAAGRQLLDPATRTRKPIAIDKDIATLKELKANIVAAAFKPERRKDPARSCSATGIGLPARALGAQVTDKLHAK